MYVCVYKFHLHEGPGTVSHRMEVTGAGEKEKGIIMLSGESVSVQEDKKVLEMDGRRL